METGQLAGWLQAGGVLAFATAVWWELRAQRAERASHNAEVNRILAAIQSALSGLLERERIRHGTGPFGVPRTPTPPPDE